MREKPWHFNLLALFLLGCGLSIPLQVANMHQLHVFFDINIIFQQIEPMGWLFIAFSLWASYLMFSASKKLVWVIPLLCLYTGVMNASSVEGASYLTLANVTIVTLGFFVPFTLLLLAPPKQVLQDPEKKWWAHPERKRVHIPMFVTAPFNQSFSVNSYDISLGGAFISFDDINSSMSRIGLTGKRSGIKVGDLLKIKIQSGRFTSIYCQGKVVRIMEEPKGGYPGGIGIQFMHIRKRDQKRLKTILSDLERITASA